MFRSNRPQRPRLRRLRPTALVRKLCARTVPAQPCLTINAASSSTRILPWAIGQWAMSTPIWSRSGEPAGEREKLVIAASYYWGVTGELDKAAQAFQEQIESYPRDYRAYLDVG